MHANEPIAPISRRAFLRNGSLFLLASSCTGKLWAADEARPKLRVGLVTDLHYADKPSSGTRYYRETLAKFTAAAEQFAKDKPDLFVHLGDLIDSGDSVAAELAFVKRMNEPFQALQGPKYYVLGNHCVERLTKTEFLDGVGQQKSFYSFNVGNTHFVVLDACFTSDGKPYGRNNSKWDDSNIPASQLEWLEADLKSASKPVIVFAHQRLDVDSTDVGEKRRRRSQVARNFRESSRGASRAQPPKRPAGNRRHPLLHVAGDGRRLGP